MLAETVAQTDCMIMEIGMAGCVLVGALQKNWKDNRANDQDEKIDLIVRLTLLNKSSAHAYDQNVKKINHIKGIYLNDKSYAWQKDSWIVYF